MAELLTLFDVEPYTALPAPDPAAPVWLTGTVGGHLGHLLHVARWPRHRRTRPATAWSLCGQEMATTSMDYPEHVTCTWCLRRMRQREGET